MEFIGESELDGMRSFNTAFDAEFLKNYQAGSLRYLYRGVPCKKSPIDLAIYLRLLWREKPASIIEIGTKAGGSAMFFADISKLFALDANVCSVDIEPVELPPTTEVRFLQGDVHNLDEVFWKNGLADLPRPWLVVEDSAHTFKACTAALSFFSRKLEPGELLVIEDGVLEDLGLAHRYQGGPNLAISEFMRQEPETFDVAYEYTDMFGVNATYNPNGYLRKL